uniref:hypothetical protein n=1 Tax=Roseobacter sp. HKCCA2468 TaxID=3120342 RepID=UPI0030EF4D59
MGTSLLATAPFWLPAWPLNDQIIGKERQVIFGNHLADDHHQITLRICATACIAIN